MGTKLLIEVLDRAGAIERLLSLIRRRVMAVQVSSVSREGSEGRWLVVLMPNHAEAPLDRYVHEIRHLVDVRKVRLVTRSEARVKREMAVLQLRNFTPTALPDGIREVARDGDQITVEITGSSQDIDQALEEFRTQGVLGSYLRTGEAVMPVVKSTRSKPNQGEPL